MSTDKTPIDVLQKEISFFNNSRRRIETKEGMFIDPDRIEEIEANLKKLHSELGERVKVFEAAIETLTDAAQQSRERSIAFVEWKDDNFLRYEGEYYSEDRDDGKIYTIPEMYDLYLDHLTKNKKNK